MDGICCHSLLLPCMHEPHTFVRMGRCMLVISFPYLLPPLDCSITTRLAHHAAQLFRFLTCVMACVSIELMQDGATPMVIAAHNGHLDVVKHLLSVGADKDKAKPVIRFGMSVHTNAQP